MLIKYLSVTLLCLCLLPKTAVAELLIGPVTLISAHLPEPLSKAYVRVEQGKIVQISQQPLQKKNNEVYIEATGQYLIPGLMDSHVHLSNMPGLTLNHLLNNKQLALQRTFLQQQPRSYLYFGVTQLLDPTQSLQGVNRFNQVSIKPDLLYCGALPLLGGYPSVFGTTERALKAFEFLLIDPEVSPELPQGTDITHFSPEVQIARIKQQGATCIKLFLEDGFGLASDWPLLTRTWLKRIVELAQKYQLKVLAHANAIDMQQIALEIGVDVLAHGMWHWNQYNRSGAIPVEVRTVLDQIADTQVVYQPTFNVMDGLQEIIQQGKLVDPAYTHVVPASLLNWYQTEQAQWFRKQLIADYQGLSLGQIQRSQQQTIHRGEKSFQYLLSKQHPMVLASDTPSSPVYTAQPGLSTYKELIHMHNAGLTLEQVLAAATINNARAFDVEHLYGSIELGKVANLLLLKENPLATIDAYNSIDKVILRGNVIDREQLSAR